MGRIQITAVVAAGIALAACGGDDPVADQPSNIVGEIGDSDPANAAEAAVANDSVVAANDTDGVAEPTAAEAQIPAALHGRWGMTPGDCTSTRGDAKGLLIISGDRLRFYESVGRPQSGIAVTDQSISATFAFTGEGQTWTREEALQVQGNTLTRTEGEPPRSYTYARC